MVLAGCASPVVPGKLAQIDENAGYRYGTLDKQSPKALRDTAVLLAFSGGGTRAAALTEGALRALADTQVPTPAGSVPLATQIDVISSVSGGSVTAAAFALGGTSGLGSYEKNFLRQDAQGSMITGVILNPTKLAWPRIDILRDYLDDNVFNHKTYQDLITIDKLPYERRPYVILNATDMASGSVFSFTQDQFDLICGDLTTVKLADAVAASAAFPVALSAVTIQNQAGCPAQQAAPANPRSGWETDARGAVPSRVAEDRAVEQPDQAGIEYPIARNFDRFHRGTVALTYLNREGQKNYVQLLDGGLADNVGLTMPYILMTSAEFAPSVQSWVNLGVNKLLFIVVNARNETDNDFGTHASSPGIVDTLENTINTPIDATTFQLIDHLGDELDPRLKTKGIVMVDFDFIRDAGCRVHFIHLVTSWALSQQDITDLIALGRAMVLQSPDYQKLVTALGATAPVAIPSVDQICAPYKTPVKTAAP